MIQGSFCSKLNALSYDIRWTFKILPEMKTSSEKMVRRSFPTPLAGRSDHFFVVFLLQVMIF